MAHKGHRENPIQVIAEGDLDRAVTRNWDPSPEQAVAGNYQKAHAVMGVPPLYVTIETPRDRFRKGIGPDGTPWSVKMPSHYGYIKRTKGADGDQVDVYIGPHAHAVHQHPVWIVDQADAETGAFDEHKCMLGFSDGRNASAAYLSAFSDGKGPERIGAVTRMDYASFLGWLLDGDTTAPLGMYKSNVVFSASGCGCGATHSRCSCQTGGLGDSMTTAVKVDATPRGFGNLVKSMGALWARMNTEERTAIMNDVSLESSLSLDKASKMLEHADDNSRIRRVEDQWDGPPDDDLETVEAHGPGSSVEPGKVNLGPSQASTGADTMRMESQYSRHTPQTGVQAATERLGRKLASHHSAMKGLIAFGKSMAERIALLETTSLSSVSPQVDMVAIKAEIAKATSAAVALALAKAIPEVVRTVAKAKKAAGESDKEGGEGDEDEEDDEDEDDSESESGSGTEIEITNELEEEGEDEDGEDEGKKAKSKAAAVERLVAKSILRVAKASAKAADDAMKDGMHHAGARHHKSARKRMEKAQTHLAVAKALQAGRVGASTKSVENSIAALAKALKKTKADNQDKWPNHGGMDKSVTTTTSAATGTATQTSVDVTPETKALIQKSLEGMALLQMNMEQVMQVVGGQSRHSVDGISPSVALVKAAETTVTKEQQIVALATAGQITMAERDKGLDAAVTMRMPSMPQGAIDATIASCSAPVQAVLRAA